MIPSMAGINTLLEGYKRFYAKHFLNNVELYKHLASKGQSPKTLVIGCSDARVDPAILMDANAGDIFSIRNVANLVPPYQPEDDTYHGTSAALEFAVNHIAVEHIVVLGHSGCAGIKTLVDSDDQSDKDFSFIHSWVNIAHQAKERTFEQCKHDASERYVTCEKEGIKTSIENLLTFPWVKEKVDNGSIQLHGWYFSLHTGELFTLSENNTYEPVPLP